MRHDPTKTRASSLPQQEKPRYRRVRRNQADRDAAFKAKQDARYQEMAEAVTSGDTERSNFLAKQIAASERGHHAQVIKRQKIEEQHKRGVDSDARQERLSPVRINRTAEVQRLASLFTPEIERDEWLYAPESMLYTAEAVGKRDEAYLVSASPDIHGLCHDGDSEHHARIAHSVMCKAVHLATQGHARRRVLREFILSPPKGIETPSKVMAKRAELMMACMGLRPDDCTWMLVRHAGTDTEQGEHYHLVIVSNNPEMRGGHATCALASQIWANWCSAPEEAQNPSLSTKPWAVAEWKRLSQDAGKHLQHSGIKRPMAKWMAPEFAAGLWLCKGGERYEDASRRIEHALGMD